jgi:hypothetical protein
VGVICQHKSQNASNIWNNGAGTYKINVKKEGNIYFSMSNGWLANLRRRHQIVFHKVCGGVGNVCEETVTQWVA